MHAAASGRWLVMLVIAVFLSTSCIPTPQRSDLHPEEKPSGDPTGNIEAEPGGANRSVPGVAPVGGEPAPEEPVIAIDPNAPPVMVVELIERNEDSFPARLIEYDGDHGDEAPPPFQIVEGRLVIHEPERHSDVFDLQTLVVEPAGTPLAECKLFVIHTTHYAGVGRVDAVEMYYAFAELPAAIARPTTLTGDTYEYDPASGAMPFETAIFTVRVYPDDAAKLEFREAEGEALELTLGSITQEIAPGASVDLFTASRQVTLRELPLLSSSVTDSDDLFDESPPPAAGPVQEVFPGRDHGRLEFSTKLSATYHGKLPLTTQLPLTIEETEL